MDWNQLLEGLNRELEKGYDPLYDSAAGDSLLNLCYEVEKTMDLLLEPSIQAGAGGIWIYKSGECVAGNIDYQDFNSDCIDIAFESSSASEFKSKYSEYLESIIN